MANSTSVQVTIPGRELIAMGPARAKQYLQAKAFEQRAELDALLAFMQYDGLAVRYTRQMRIKWAGADSELVLVGSKGEEADVLVLIRQLALTSEVILCTTLEYERLS